MTRRPSVLVVIPGHLSTSPRLLKIADACADAGYRVRVVSGSFMPWAAAADVEVARSRKWAWRPVEYRPEVARHAYLTSGMRRHAARTIARTVSAERAPWWAVTRAQSRAYDELRRAALTDPFDMVVGGSVGGLALVPELAGRRNTPSLLDLEDLHTGESEAPDADFQHECARRILAEALATVAVVTTSSDAIADAYSQQFGVRPTVIHNVFTMPRTVAETSRQGPLRMYWFSQTVGRGRGLEDAVRAVGMAGIEAVLTLRGRADEGYVSGLASEAARVAPRLDLRIEAPAGPDAMLPLCEGHDIGLSLEPPSTPNRQRCLSNKAFTYLPAGLPVVFSDTPAQRWLAAQLGEAAVTYPSGDAGALATVLAGWAADRDALAGAGRAARRAACDRWRWDHPLERDAVLNLIEGALA